MKISEEKKGEIYILVGAIFWGIFPVITILSLNYLSPVASLAWSALFSTVSFAIILAVRKRWQEIKNVSALKDILWLTLFNSLIYYILFFLGLKYTSAGNASILALSEVLFAFLFFNIYHKEYLSKEHIIGAILMLGGAGIVLYPNFTDFKIGDILITLAVAAAPIGNYFQRRARKRVSSETILFLRNLFALPFLFIFASLLTSKPLTDGLQESVFFVLINGVVLLGLIKILWVEAIHRISVTKANALSSINPLFTLVFAWIILGDLPTVWQLSSIVPMIAGVILLGMNKQTNW